MSRFALTISVAVLALLIYPSLIFAQTPPALEDIEVRWIFKSVYDEASPEEEIGRQAVNVLIFAEGFTAGEKETFFSFSVEQSAFFIRSVPYYNRFNVLAVFLPSLESGVDIPSEGIVKDTALNAYKGDKFIRVISNLTTYLELALGRGEISARDFPAVLVNYAGGAALDHFNGYLTIIDTSSKSVPYALTHELGHQIAWLGDEYEQSQIYLDKYGRRYKINLFGDNSFAKDADGFPIIPREKIPWAPLLDDVPIPTSRIPYEEFGRTYFKAPDEYKNKIGCFSDLNILFYPTWTLCLMKGSGQPYDPGGFCPVCQHAWATKILSLTSPVLERRGSIGAFAQELFGFELAPLPGPGVPFITAFAPISRLGDSSDPYAYAVNWLVDGATVPEWNGQTALSLESLNARFPSGFTKVEARIKDPVHLVYNPYLLDGHRLPAEFQRDDYTVTAITLYEDAPPVLAAPTSVSLHRGDKVGDLAVSWSYPSSADTPEKWVIHLYEGPGSGQFKMSQEIANPSARNYVFPDMISLSGFRYRAFVAASSRGALGAFGVSDSLDLVPAPENITISLVDESSGQVSVSWVWNYPDPTDFLVQVGSLTAPVPGSARSATLGLPEPGVYRAYVTAFWPSGQSAEGLRSPELEWLGGGQLNTPTPTPTITPTPTPTEIVTTPVPTPLPTDTPTSTPTPAPTPGPIQVLHSFNNGDWVKIGGGIDGSYPEGFWQVTADWVEVIVAEGQVVTFLLPEVKVSGNKVRISMEVRADTPQGTVYLVALDSALTGTLVMNAVYELDRFVNDWLPLEIFITDPQSGGGIRPLVQVVGASDTVLRVRFRNLVAKTFFFLEER